MDACYEVYLGNSTVGKVQISQQGLYCVVLCRCIVPKDRIYRLYAVRGDVLENLGVVVPEGDGFLLDRRIAAKKLEGCSKYILSAGPDPEAETFVPLHPEEPFAYLRSLEHAFLEVRNGQTGVRIQENPGAV